MTDWIIPTYAAYLAVSIALTVWVARTLHQNGRVFLVDVFRGREALADSVNHLLVVGFYLINLGFISWTLESHQPVTSARFSVELVSNKVGAVLVVLGLMHFFNLFILTAIRARTRWLAQRETAAGGSGWLAQAGATAS